MQEQSFSELCGDLAGQRLQIVRDFYHLLFERYPEYRSMFPEDMEPQMEKMVEMLGAVARLSDRIPIIRPYLLSVGKAHKSLGIGREDLDKVGAVMIETLAKSDAASSQDDPSAYLRNAFTDTIIPMVAEGLEQ